MYLCSHRQYRFKPDDNGFRLSSGKLFVAHGNHPGVTITHIYEYDIVKMGYHLLR